MSLKLIHAATGEVFKRAIRENPCRTATHYPPTPYLQDAEKYNLPGFYACAF